LPLKADGQRSHSQYVQSLKSHLEESYRLASQNAETNADKNKARFDRKVTVSLLEPGDRVLVRNVKLRGKHKLADKWETDIYVVVKRAGDLPVYTVKPENRQGPIRTLHRDLLLPCGFLPPQEEIDISTLKLVSKPRTRQTTNMEHPKADDFTEMDDKLSFTWGDDSPCQDIIRFTTVYEYPTIEREETNKTIGPPPDSDLPSSDLQMEQKFHEPQPSDYTNGSVAAIEVTMAETEPNVTHMHSITEG